MQTELAGIALAAGRGNRLRPLTDHLPKALCPVGNLALVDHAIARLRPLCAQIAVNVHYKPDQMLAHLGSRVHVSVEQPAALGTAGAVGQLRDWVNGRAAVVTNADAWIEGGLAGLLDGWDGRRVRLLVTSDADRADFGRDLRFAGASVMPWDVVRRLRPEPSGLYEACWRALEAAGELEFCLASGRFIDCGTPADYLAANLAVSGGQSVVGEGAVVEGELLRSVVWPGGVVRKSERLVDAIRVGAELTVDGKASTA